MTATCKSVILPSSLILVALVPSDLNYCNIVWVTPHRFSLNKLLQVTNLMSALIIAHTQPGGKKIMSIHPYVHLNGTFPLNSEDTESAVPSVQVNSKPAVKIQLKRFLLVNHHYDYHLAHCSTHVLSQIFSVTYYCAIIIFVGLSLVYF